MTKLKYLSLRRTGWFYLLLLALGLVAWLQFSGQFAWLNQWNRELLYQALPQTEIPSKLLQVELSVGHDQLENGADIEKIRSMLEKFPDSQWLVVGNRLQKKVSQVVEEALLNRRGKIILATQLKASRVNFLRGDRQLKWYDYYWRQLPQLALPEWQQIPASDLSIRTPLIFAPRLDESYSSNLLWRQEQQIFPGILSWALAAIAGTDSLELDKTTDFSLSHAEARWSLGYQGKVFAAGEGLRKIEVENLLLRDSAEMPRLILLSEYGDKTAERLSQTLARLEQRNYLSQNLWTQLGFWLIWLISLWGFYRVSQKGWLLQCTALIGYGLLLLVVQYLLFTQFLWFAILPLLAWVLPILLVLAAYHSERNLFNRHLEITNRVLGLAAPYLYKARDFDKLQPWLEKIRSDPVLNETLFDLGLQAEGEQNKTLALKLFEWIEASGIEHRGAKDKLGEYRAQASAGDEDLSATLVIKPGQTNSGSFSNPALQIENFGRYQVEGVLGKGAMGIVFQGVDPKINRQVAIKTLQLSGDETNESFAETKRRFFREAETAGNLSHANIVTIYDVGEEGELGYIAMDLLTGAPLSNFLKPESRLPAPLVYQLMIQITDALDYAHRQNVVHRDIKPANIIFDDDIQRVTLTDFGIACLTDQSKTRTGTIMGSPFYMSPEQVLGERVDGRSDIFSLGVTFYQLLSGHLPFTGESIASVAYHITKSKQESVRKWDSKLPASAVRITNKALQKDMKKRFQTMAEFKLALVSALKRDFKKAPIV